MLKFKHLTLLSFIVLALALMFGSIDALLTVLSGTLTMYGFLAAAVLAGKFWNEVSLLAFRAKQRIRGFRRV